MFRFRGVRRLNTRICLDFKPFPCSIMANLMRKRLRTASKENRQQPKESKRGTSCVWPANFITTIRENRWRSSFALGTFNRRITGRRTGKKNNFQPIEDKIAESFEISEGFFGIKTDKNGAKRKYVNGKEVPLNDLTDAKSTNPGKNSTPPTNNKDHTTDAAA